MLPNKSEKLLDNIQKFNNNFRKNFDLDKFEARAEELERNNAGKGYQMAYHESIFEMFKNRLQELSERNSDVMPFDHMITQFDLEIMDRYDSECRKQNIETNLKLNYLKTQLSDEVLVGLKKILDEAPTTPIKKAKEELKNGTVTPESALKWVDQIRKESTETPPKPDKENALKMVAYAKAIQEKNESRNFFQFIGSILNLSYFREKSAINTLRSFASRCEGIDKLEAEANIESERFRDTRNMIEFGLGIRKPEMSKDKLMLLDDFDDEKAKETSPFQKPERDILKSSIENLLD